MTVINKNAQNSFLLFKELIINWAGFPEALRTTLLLLTFTGCFSKADLSTKGVTVRVFVPELSRFGASSQTTRFKMSLKMDIRAGVC